MATASKSKTVRSRVKKTAKKSFSRKEMTSATEFLEHELKDVYTAEHLLLEALETLAGDSTVPALVEAFTHHRAETQGHIDRLDAVGEALGIDMETAECKGVEGLIQEKVAFGEEHPSDALVNLFNAGAGQKSERYEITHYEGLIELMTRLGHKDAAHTLQQTLREEEAALKTLKTIEHQLELPQSDAENEESDEDKD
jgi:ferritin-like metal-binding protein YciE